MSYIAERRLEEKERRRAEIVDAAEHVAASVGWEELTMDQVARKARLSRALLYVYFKDKQDLMFALNERALDVLKQKCEQVVKTHKRGIDQIEGIGRAYLEMSQEYPVYFDVHSRCELIAVGEVEPNSNLQSCLKAGNDVFEIIGESLQLGIKDGSIRSDIDSPSLIGFTLWGFMHGVIQVATKKPIVLASRDVKPAALLEQALELALRSLMPTKKSR